MLEATEKTTDRIPTRAELTRERILQAAEVVFAKYGLNGSRVREIAQTAGVNAATIYSYFPSKNDLHEAVLERGMRPLLDLMLEFSAKPNAMEAAGRLLRGAMQHLSRRPNLSRLIYLEIISEGAYLAELTRRWLRPLLEPGLAQLREGTESTPWGGNHAPLIVTTFVQLAFGHFALAPLFREVIDGDPTSEEWVAHQTRFMLALLEQMFPDGFEGVA
jgi:AcrR family transcriptional regulator